MQFGFLSMVALAEAGIPAVVDYTSWKLEWGMEFNGDEDTLRQAVFEANTAEIVAQNNKYTNGEDSWFAVQNQFTALTESEFVAQYLNFDPASQSILNQSAIPVVLGNYATVEAGSKDWNTSPVKDQGSCGSCWAFGAVAGMESEIIRQLSRSDILSEQYVMDCTSSNACSGGRADSAYPQLYGKALYTADSYPYQARNGNCHDGTDSGVRITSFTRTSRPVTDSGLASALDTAAQVVAVGASSWSSYGGGVYTGSTSCSLNHQVQATGYDTDYLKVKNSWGKSWGEGGYIRLARTSAGCGTSGILSDGGFYPTMEAASPSPSPAPTPTPTPSPTPTPTPTPVPVPTPSPSPTPSCSDNESEYYCNYVKEQGWCDLIGYDCLSTCGCCSNPSACGDPSANSGLRVKVLAAVAVAV